MAAKAVPKVEPYTHTEFECKPSPYDNVPKLPMRAMICAPSCAGKTVLLQNMILKIYRGCFNRIYVLSPSIDIDHTWKPVKDYIEKEIKPSDKENIYFDTYEPEELHNIITKQHKVTEYLKSQGKTQLFQILIVIDDFADDVQVTRNSKLLHQLYIRGRHQVISTITASQVYKLISPIVRKNITHLFIYRLRNQAELQAIIEEVSAVHNPKVLLELYNVATREPYSFLYINLLAKIVEGMFFFKNFDERLQVLQ